MEYNGWIKLHRQIINSEIFRDADLLKLFILCLLRANHEKRFVQIDSRKKAVEVQPGQFVTGRFSLHEEFFGQLTTKKKSASTVWNWLKRLEEMGMVNIKSETKYSIISIVNWEKFQHKDVEVDRSLTDRSQQADSKLTTGSQQTDTDKNVKNKENEKNEKNEKKKALRKNPENLPAPIHEKTLFEQFWDIYPKKEAREYAKACWDRHVKDDPEIVRAISKTLRWQVETEQWTKQKGKFIPQPSKYINQHLWENEPPTPYEPAESQSGFNDPRVMELLKEAEAERIQKDEDRKARQKARDDALDKELGR